MGKSSFHKPHDKLFSNCTYLAARLKINKVSSKKISQEAIDLWY